MVFDSKSKRDYGALNSSSFRFNGSERDFVGVPMVFSCLP